MNFIFTVEFNYIDTEWGRKLMNIAGFMTREDAEDFAKDYADAKVIESVEIWTYKNGRKKVLYKKGA